MRFSIQREDFLKPLRAVAGVVERHRQTPVNPILGHVLIRVKDQRLSLIATDQEIELFATTALKEPVAIEGETTVSIRKLLDICVALPEAQILSFSAEAGRCVICAGRSRLTLSTLEAAEFPALTEHVGELHFSMSKTKLRSLIAQTEFAMAERDVRAYLNGMLWEIKEQKLYQVAADGHRLAFAFAAIDVEPGQAIRVLVPRKAIVGLQRTLLQRSDDQAEELIQISMGTQHIQLETAETRLSAGLLESNFPDFFRIVHNVGDKALLISRDQLKESLQRAAALLGDRSSGVSFSLSEGALKILAKNAEQDEIEDDLVVDYKGEALVISFNIKYLMDFLNVLSTEMLRFSFSDANSSAHLVGVGESNAAYVIMPMSI